MEVQNGGFRTSSGTTNNSGTVCGLIPSNETIILEVYFTNCDEEQILYEKQIDPFSRDSTVDVVLDIAKFENISISASVIKCNSNEFKKNGYKTR